MVKKQINATISRINGVFSLIDKTTVDIIATGVSFNSLHKNTVRILSGVNEHLFIGMRSINCLQDNKMAQFFKLSDAGINTPDIIHSSNIGRMLKHMDFDKKYVLKPIYGARSLGQIVVDAEKYNKLTDDVHDVTLPREKFNIKHNVDVGKCISAGDEFTLYDALSVGTVLLSELKNVISEYRVIAFNNTTPDMWVYEKRQGYLAGSKEKRKHEVVKYSTIEKELVSSLLYSMREFITIHKFPFLAFDAYLTADGEVGVFEFDPYGFGIDYPLATLKYLRSNLTNSLYEAILNLQQEDSQHAQ